MALEKYTLESLLEDYKKKIETDYPDVNTFILHKLAELELEIIRLNRE